MKGSLIITKVALAVLVIAGMSATSCKRTEIEIPPVVTSDTEMAVQANINGAKVEQAAMTRAGDGTGSRATFALGDIIGVYVIPYRAPVSGSVPATAGILEPSGNYVNNMKFSYLTVSSSNIWQAEKTVFYPTVNSDIYAFAPFDEQFTPTETPEAYRVSVPANQGAKASVMGADFMTAKLTSIAATTTPLALKFHHRLSKVDVKFAVPATFLGRQVMSVKSMTLRGFKMQGEMNLVSDYTSTIGSVSGCPTAAVVSAGATTDNITPHMVTDAVIGTQNTFHYEAIVVPQTLVGGLGFVDIELEMKDGKMEHFFYKVPEGEQQKFEAGLEQLITVTFQKDQTFLLGTVDIQPWGKASDVSGEVVQTEVFNDFMLRLPSALATQVTTVRVKCNNETYTLPATHLAGGNTVQFAFDGSLSSPEYYPYMVKNVELLDAQNNVLNGVGEIYVKEVLKKGSATLRSGAWSANSYVIAPGESVKINVMRAGNDLADTLSYSMALANRVASVRILWQTAQGHAGTGDMVLESVNYSNGVATVKARAAGGGGNAVVAAYDQTTGGNILWSWHIWVPGSTIGHSSALPVINQAAAGGDKKFMDRNLGAITASAGNTGAYGMLYQWGRKDPFTSSTGMTAADAWTGTVAIFDAAGAALDSPVNGVSTTTGFKYVESDADNLAMAVKNPMTLYHATDGNWTINSALDYYWMRPISCESGYVSNKGSKGIYDPCPAGYRIAGDGAYDGFPITTWAAWNPAGGQNWLGVWWPATGFRITTSGLFGNTGCSCVVWSSSPSSAAGGYDLDFYYSGTMQTNASSNRARGLSVRCVQE